MGFSNIVAKQREKEAKALKTFLAFSLIGSLALHIGVLTLGIGNLLNRAAEIEDEPIEVTIVEPQSIQALEPKQEAESKGGSGAEGNGGGSSGGGGIPRKVSQPSAQSQVSKRAIAPSEPSIIAEKQPTSVANPPRESLPRKVSQPSAQSQVSKRVIAPSEPSIIAEKQPTSVANPPRESLVESLKTEPTQQQNPAQTPKPTWMPEPVQKQKPAETASPEIAAEPKPVVTLSPSPSNNPEPAPNLQPAPVAINRFPQNVKPTVPNSLPLQNRDQSNEKLRDSLTDIRNTRQNQGIAANSTRSSNKPREEGDRDRDVAANLGNRTGSSSGTDTRTGSGSGSTVATGSSGNSRRGTERGEGNGNGDSTGFGSSRPAGGRCSKPKYPERARRLGQEGTVGLSVDVDEKGNVTNVRLTRSSGHSTLDEAAIREAWRCKFDAAAAGRQGIPTGFRFHY